MDYKAGIVQLSSSDGEILEIPEIKLSEDDLSYIRSQDMYRKAHRKVTSFFRFPFRSLIYLGIGIASGYDSDRSACCFFSLFDRI